MIPVEIAQEMLDQICRLCRRLNPQHSNCNYCERTEPWRRAIKGPTEDATKPPPDWSTTVKIPIPSAGLSIDNLISATIDAAGSTADVPKKYQDCWMATSIETVGRHFIVTLAAWDADIVIPTDRR